MFVVFEGIDGSGKTTQAKMLVDYLKKSRIECEFTEEPTSGPVGKLIREIVRADKGLDPSVVQLLFCADRAHHITSMVMPALRAGKIVVCDRYSFSTIVYGAAAGLDVDWLEKINSRFPVPNITFIFDLSPREAMERLSSRAEEFIKRKAAIMKQDEQLYRDKATTSMFERIGFLGRVRMAYKEMAETHKNCYLIDSHRKKQEVHKEIVKILQEKI